MHTCLNHERMDRKCFPRDQNRAEPAAAWIRRGITRPSPTDSPRQRHQPGDEQIHPDGANDLRGRDQLTSFYRPGRTRKSRPCRPGGRPVRRGARPADWPRICAGRLVIEATDRSRRTESGSQLPRERGVRRQRPAGRVGGGQPAAAARATSGIPSH